MRKNPYKELFGKDVYDSIVSRSTILSHKYPEVFDKEDLIQEGYLTVLEIKNKKPDAPLNYILGALNHKYSKIDRDEARTCKIERRHIKEYDDSPYEDKDIIGKIHEAVALRKVQGLCIREACEQVGLPDKICTKVKSVYHNRKRSNTWQRLMNAR